MGTGTGPLAAGQGTSVRRDPPRRPGRVRRDLRGRGPVDRPVGGRGRRLGRGGRGRPQRRGAGPAPASVGVLELLAQIEPAQHVGEGIAQGKGAGPHLQHALRILAPRPGPAPQPGAAGVLHAEAALDRPALAAPLDRAGGAPGLGGLALELPRAPLAEAAGAHQSQGAVAPDRRPAVDDGDALEGGQRREPQLEPVQDGDEAGLAACRGPAGRGPRRRWPGPAARPPRACAARWRAAATRRSGSGQATATATGMGHDSLPQAATYLRPGRRP